MGETKMRPEVKSIKDLKREIEKVINEFPNYPDYAIPHIRNLLNSFEDGLREKLEAVKLGHPGYTTDPDHPSGQHKQGWLEALRRVLGEE